MIVEPELDEPRWLRIGEIHFAQTLEGRQSGISWVRYDSVDHFQAINVGLMLEVPRNSVAERRGEKAEHT